MQSATTSYDARTSQVFAEAGHVLPLGRAAIEPFAGVAWVGIESDGFTEAGGTAALRGSAGSAETFASTLGLRGRVEIGALSLKGKVAWQHDFDADPSRAILAFDTAPGTRFTVTGVTGDEDVGVIELGAETRLAGAARLSLVYSGRIGARSEDHGARATLSLPF
jgi:outer membrane autotransporter protein